MNLNFFSDTLLWNFSLLPALFSLIAINENATKEILGKVISDLKETKTNQGNTNPTLQTKKMSKTAKAIPKTIFILAAISVSIYLILVFCKTAFPIISTYKVLSIDWSPFSLSIFVSDNLQSLTADFLSILVFLLSWLQFFIVVTIFVLTFIILNVKVKYTKNELN